MSDLAARMWQGGFVVSLLRRIRADERARFVIVGGVNTVVAYMLFLGFEWMLGGRYLVSLGLAYLIATVIAFFLHRRLTFGVTGSTGILLDFVRFESVYVVMLAINAVLLFVLVDVAHWQAWSAQALIVVITTLVSYLGHKFFSFRRPSARASGDRASGDEFAPGATEGTSEIRRVRRSPRRAGTL